MTDLRTELTAVMVNPTGTVYGESVDDILNDTLTFLDPSNEFTKTEASDAVASLRRVIEEIKGLLQ